MNSMKGTSLQVSDASLSYEIRGSGPVLLMIPGGPADASVFADIAPRLAQWYTVVTYDPRGLGRSTLDARPEDQRIVEIMADDAHRLLATVGSKPAFVFSSSGGALVGLELVRHHAQQVRTLVAHEPPAVVLLPDGPAIRASMQGAYDAYRCAGVGPGMQKFLAAAGLADEPEPVDEPSKPEPEAVDEAGREMEANAAFFLAHYMLPVTFSQPDKAALLTTSSRVVVAVGEAEAAHVGYRGGLALAKLLGTEVVVFPGGHGGFLTHPDAFAAMLRQVLEV